MSIPPPSDRNVGFNQESRSKVSLSHNSVIAHPDFAAPATNGRFSLCGAANDFRRPHFCTCERQRRSTSALGSQPPCGGAEKYPVLKASECQLQTIRQDWNTAAANAHFPPIVKGAASGPNRPFDCGRVQSVAVPKAVIGAGCSILA